MSRRSLPCALSFAFRFDAPPLRDTGAGYTHLAILEIDDAPCNTTPGGKQRGVELTASGNDAGDMFVGMKGMKGADTCDGGDASDDYMSVKLPLRVAELGGPKFHQTSLTIVKGAQCNGVGKASLVVTIDGLVVPCVSLGIDPFLVASSKMRSILGLYVGGVDPLEGSVTYDNVQIDLD